MRREASRDVRACRERGACSSSEQSVVSMTMRARVADLVVHTARAQCECVCVYRLRTRDELGNKKNIVFYYVHIYAINISHTDTHTHTHTRSLRLIGGDGHTPQQKRNATHAHTQRLERIHSVLIRFVYVYYAMCVDAYALRDSYISYRQSI